MYLEFLGQQPVVKRMSRLVQLFRPENGEQVVKFTKYFVSTSYVFYF